MRAIKKTIALIIALVLGVGASASAATLPAQWDPNRVAVNQDTSNSFLIRPGEILAGPGDAADVAQVLASGWRQNDNRPFGVTKFIRTTPSGGDPVKDIQATLARIRLRTAGRPQGPAKVAPNYVFVGEAGLPADAISFTGEPRIQGGPGSSARFAPMPKVFPQRTKNATDGAGVRVAVLDTGMFDHPWLTGVQRAPGSNDVWDVEGDGYADAESGHGTFIAGLILQVAPSASVYAAKVLDSHGVGDDFGVAAAMAALPADIRIVNLSLGGYTDHDEPPLAIENAIQAWGSKRIVVAAAGNDGAKRPFWPAAFNDILAVGAADPVNGNWDRASYSNFGSWVDATARGTNLQSTFAFGKTKVAQGRTISRLDPSLQFGGWAAWDGTSFATPIAAAMIARTMSRERLSEPYEAQRKLLAGAPRAPADFPNAVLLDELEGDKDPLS